MPAATGALVMKDASIKINAIEYANQVRKARFVPDQSTQTYKTLVPDGSLQDVDNAVWTLELEGLQINATGGLAKALRTAAGTSVAAIVQPKLGTGQDIATCTILVPEIPFGGEQGEYMTIDLSIPCVGKPVLSVAP
jgi:hypothetical protein